MLTAINPKLPMRNKAITSDFYINILGFEKLGKEDYDGYLMLRKDHIEIHFFEFKELDPLENYGQVYIRTNDIEAFYDLALMNKLNIPSAGHLHTKPWGQKEFALLDPDHNSLTFGQSEVIF
ncbi:MAG: VOC family protein [Pedobacter sp.]|nr:MAG: VOC family protein [Pedobacter sp.]